ncbi:MAG: sugar ABC transporter permease [Clostridia bacterium]|nr:sugar ABC transporter permease [Clostridia bacterium]
MQKVQGHYRKVPFIRRLGQNVRQHPWLYLMILPAIAYFIIFHYLPMYGVVISFQDYHPIRGIANSKWVGLKHFSAFLNGPFFWRLLRNTLSINIGLLIFGFPLPILFALLLNEVRSGPFKKVVQTITYMPHFVSSVVVCGLMVIFCRSDGILTFLLSKVGLPASNLLTYKQYFQPLYIAMNIWQELGWDSIIYFAALAGVDASLYEAAYVDGAGRWRQMWHITIPSIMPTIMILLVMRVGNLLSLGWDRIFLLYNDMVMETADVISTYVYRTGMVQMQYSFASAVGLMNSLVNVVLLIGANALSRKFTESSLW